MRYYEKEEPSAKEYQRILNSTKVFQTELVNIDYSLGELAKLALEHAEERKGAEEGNYVKFLNLWLAHYGETEQQKIDRLICNFIRHKLTSYDLIINKPTEKYWVPKEFFEHAWNQVMLEIVKKYPSLKETYRIGSIIKMEYDDFCLTGETSDEKFTEFLFDNWR